MKINQQDNKFIKESEIVKREETDRSPAILAKFSQHVVEDVTGLILVVVVKSFYPSCRNTHTHFYIYYITIRNVVAVKYCP